MVIQRFVLAASAGLCLVAATANATISQQVYVGYDADPTVFGDPSEHDDGDVIRGATAADIDRALYASINAPSAPVYGAWGSVGEFGNYGLSGNISTAGELRLQVVIEDDNIVNLTGRAQSVKANFIIDGGTFGLAYAPGASIEYTLTLAGSSLPGSPGGAWFQSGGELNSGYGATGNVTTFSDFGADIGAVFDAATSTVDIPLSFQSVDLGVLLPNESMALRYQMDIIAMVPSYAEFAMMEFMDPFSVAGSPVDPGILRPEVAFTPYDGPPLSNVPVPPAMALFASALMVMGFLNARRAG